MVVPPESRVLHVTNGHRAAALIDRSGLPGRTSIWADPLNEGPVPDGIDDAELLRVRAGFLAADPNRASDVAADLQRWRDAIDRDDAYDELVLWFEHDLFDQLCLVQLLSFLSTRPREKPATLINVGSFPGREPFKGLGELDAGDIAALFPTRALVTPGQTALATRAWRAYRSADPRAIETLLAEDTSPLPFLAPALLRHLEEFPSESDGLSRTERRLMRLVLDEPAQLDAVLAKMHEGETAYYVADSWLFDRASDLAGVEPPLVELNGTKRIALTPAGRAVLNGEADRIRQSGIDRWLGGVHLQGRGALWRWSDKSRRIVHA